MESVSELGKNLAGTDVIVPDASDGSPPEDPYADGWSIFSQLIRAYLLGFRYS